MPEGFIKQVGGRKTLGYPTIDEIAGLSDALGSESLSGVAAIALSALTVVTLSDTYQLIQADSSNPDHAFSVLAITTQAFSSGSVASAVISDRVSDPSWNWDIRKSIYLGQNGQLTQTFPTVGFARPIAQALNPTDILFSAEEAIVWQATSL
ncbi:MAG: hypothetical protein KME13_25085 [Myxacorys californica WJT36-NPBG1]|jgi:hypothetical protein|nr:hypothetical protein [Myxacorys californica WJT36-NPBG1]